MACRTRLALRATVALCLMSTLCAVGERVFQLLGKDAQASRGARSLSILLAAGVVLVLGWIPVVDVLVPLLVILAGAGAIKLSAYRWYVGSRAPAA